MSSSNAETSTCPGCGVEVWTVPRYPSYYCPECVARATDGEGRAIMFTNASRSGGLLYSTGGDWSEEQRAVICLIDASPVVVQEARFGGVVAQPLAEPPDGAIDLRRDLREPGDDIAGGAVWQLIKRHR